MTEPDPILVTRSKAAHLCAFYIAIFIAMWYNVNIGFGLL